ncbi:MAG: tyrosine-protein phosphatase [Chloroflexota bacterium]
MTIHAAASDPARDRLIRLRGTRNLRDVGGYPAGDGRRTRWRTLLRTDALDRLPAESQQRLIDLGLRHAIDLRWPDELAAFPSVFAASDRVRYESVPLRDNNPSPAGVAATYRGILDTRSTELARIARSLIEPGGVPVVIGCAAGVDRTGVTIALLLSAVAVPADVVAADYALSVDSFRGDGAATGLDDWRGGEVTLDCRAEYMLEAVEHLERTHGGGRGLLARHGFTDADLDRLTNVLTEAVAS